MQLICDILGHPSYTAVAGCKPSPWDSLLKDRHLRDRNQHGTQHQPDSRQLWLGYQWHGGPRKLHYCTLLN